MSIRPAGSASGCRRPESISRTSPAAWSWTASGRSRIRSTRWWGRCGSGSTGSVPAARPERSPTCDTKEGDMELAMIGLGRMGGNMAHRLTDAGHTVVGWTRSGDEPLEAGDIVVDGGNSNFRDSQQHAATLAEHGIEFIDCGTSGGIWGYANGYCLMMGGGDAAVATLAPAFETLAPPDGWLHT